MTNLLRFPTAVSPTQPWFALTVPPQHEFRACRELEQHGIETYLPVRPKKHWRGLSVDYPLLPGYVFARKTDPKLIYAILRPESGLRWMWSILGTRTGPIDIPDFQISTLKLMLAQSLADVVVTPIADLWKGGEEIEITSGALAGSRGTVAHVKGKIHMVVCIEMLGRTVSVELDADAVKALEAAAPVELPVAA